MENKQEIPKLGTKEFNDLASAYFGGKPKQERMCSHTYILTSEQDHRVIQCQKCNDTQPI